MWGILLIGLPLFVYTPNLDKRVTGENSFFKHWGYIYLNMKNQFTKKTGSHLRSVIWNKMVWGGGGEGRGG